MLLGAVLALALGCRGNPTTILTRLEDSRRVTAQLQVQLSQAAEASHRAVMADTDDASVVAAQEAEGATKAVETNVATLSQLLAGLSYANEVQLLREFQADFARYQELDRRILALAVENTNLKAQALAFGPASTAANAFCGTLERFTATVPNKDRCRTDGLVAEAIRAVREIQVLHSPHIAERDDAAMARMEREMNELDAKARSALDALGAAAPSNTAPVLAESRAKLDELKLVTRKIVELSRRNTNVLSLDLAIREQPPLHAACEDRLRALTEALAKEGPKAER
ncbi:MAG: hypothetical protein ABUL60_19390 [Myxococcales bacterium]